MSKPAAESYPLQWPESVPRHEGVREGKPYKVDYFKACSDLSDELDKMGARYVVLSTNVEKRLDGRPMAHGLADAEKRDPGAACYFEWEGESYVFACDKWPHVTSNIRAIGLTIESIRRIERAGATDMLRRAFSGFKALPEAGASLIVPPKWWQVLGVDEHATWEEIESAYKQKSFEHHPDRGGDNEQFLLVQQAKQQAERART